MHGQLAMVRQLRAQPYQASSKLVVVEKENLTTEHQIHLQYFASWCMFEWETRCPSQRWMVIPYLSTPCVCHDNVLWVTAFHLQLGCFVTYSNIDWPLHASAKQALLQNDPQLLQVDLFVLKLWHSHLWKSLLALVRQCSESRSVCRKYRIRQQFISMRVLGRFVLDVSLSAMITRLAWESCHTRQHHVGC